MMLGYAALGQVALADLGIDTEGRRSQDAGMVPARDRKRRRKVIVNDRAYWATESELPGLLKALLTQAPKPQKRAKAAPKAKPAPKAREMREIVPAVELTPLPDLSARYREMLVQFQAKQDEEAINALRVAYAKAVEDDEADVEMLILGL